MIPEPMLTADLEESADGTGSGEWHANALRILASQLGFGNDYYFPLLGAAGLLDGKSQRQWRREQAEIKQREK